MVLRRNILVLGLGLAGLASTAIASAAGQQQRFGDYVVHYSAFDSASEYLPDIEPRIDALEDPERGIVVVAIRKGSRNGMLESVSADVSGSVSNLLGQSEPLHFTEVVSNGYLSYLADFDVTPLRLGRRIGRFQIDIEPHTQDGPLLLDFQERFAPSLE